MDGKEFFYSYMSNVANDRESRCYTFTYDGEVKRLPYEEKDARILEAIFSQVKNIQRPAAPASAPEPSRHEHSAPDVRSAMEKKAEEAVREDEALKPSQAEASTEDASQSEEPPVDKKAAKKAEKEEERLRKPLKKKKEGPKRPLKRKEKRRKVTQKKAEEAPSDAAEAVSREKDSSPGKQRILRRKKRPRPQEGEAAQTSGSLSETPSGDQAEPEEESAEIKEKKEKRKKALIVFGIVIGGLIILSLIYYFIFGTNSSPSQLGTNANESQQYRGYRRGYKRPSAIIKNYRKNPPSLQGPVFYKRSFR